MKLYQSAIIITALLHHAYAGDYIRIPDEQVGQVAYVGKSLADEKSSGLATTKDDLEVQQHENVCKCVTCPEDEICGGLWRGEKYKNYGKDLNNKKIHVVVSHCKSPLKWLDDFLYGYNISTIHILSKCGQTIEPSSQAIIQKLPNVGTIHHTYAHYISNILPGLAKGYENDSIVVFIKDDISAIKLDQLGIWNSLENVLNVASSDNRFACGIFPENADDGHNQFQLSVYHEFETLASYSINKKGHVTTTLGDWWKALGVEIPQLVQVCYGGYFAASVSNILKRDHDVWKAIEKDLSQGNRIQNAQYAERSWAALLASPLEQFQIDALVNKADGVYVNKESMHGALLSRPQLFLHIGVYGTYSTELLTEYLIQYQELLRLDGYNIAVHGKHDDGSHGFPNVDRLASCMWSNMNKSMFPAHQKDATLCPDELLSQLTEYMEMTQQRSQDLIILNPWLVRPGTARSLGIYIDPLWDVETVIYYRRYFEWITLMFEHWRMEFLDGSSSEQIPFSTFRYIDFLREYNKRLFYGNNVNEDPVRDLNLNAYDDIVNVKNRRLKVYADRFDLTSNVDILELTDLQEYTYFVAKQYNSVPRLRRVSIVNYHDGKDVVQNFFCHVIDAENACKAAEDIQKVDEILKEPSDMDREFVQAKEDSVGFELQMALEDIVIAAYGVGKLKAEEFRNGKKRARQFQLWVKMVNSALETKDLTVEDLPYECLYDFESRRLLQVSLEYEKSMLPAFYESPNGEDGMKETFSHWKFCSVDTKEIVQGSEWFFLFEDSNKFAVPTLPKAYVHIGAPKTGSTSLQDTMAKDREILKDDKFYLAIHGQIRRSVEEGYIIDNMLVKCDALGACIWSDEQREEVFKGSGDKDAATCPDYLPTEFDRLVKLAKDDKSELIISNEWLNRPSSETGLVDLLSGDWDPVIVIYYRRFYDWIISAHYQWHFDIGPATLDSLKGKVRLVDFFRTFCARLFASKSSSPDVLVDLTDIQEYTYHAWKRYNEVPAYENIKIVNFHGKNIIKSFYCDVIQAKGACKEEAKREQSQDTLKSRAKDNTVYYDLAAGTYWLFNKKDDVTTYNMEKLQSIAEKMKERMASRGLSENDLPIECLTKSEQEKLLSVSLAYEETLLPELYESGGKEELRRHFAKFSTENRFCSVDLKIVDDPKWAFLFE